MPYTYTLTLKDGLDYCYYNLQGTEAQPVLHNLLYTDAQLTKLTYSAARNIATRARRGFVPTNSITFIRNTHPNDNDKGRYPDDSEPL